MHAAHHRRDTHELIAFDPIQIAAGAGSDELFEAASGRFEDLLHFEARGEFQARRVDERLATRPLGESPAVSLESLELLGVVQSHGRLLSKSLDELELLSRVAPLRHGVGDHQYAHGLGVKAERYAEAALLVPLLHRDAALRVELRVGDAFQADFAALEDLAAPGVPGQRSGLAHVFVGRGRAFEECARRDRVARRVVGEQHADVGAQRLCRPADQRVENLVDDQAGADGTARLEKRGEPLCPLGLVAIELGVLEGECDDAGDRLGGRHLVRAEDAFTMGLGQLDRADHRVASDHRYDEGGALVAPSHGLAFQRAESGIVAGVHDDGRAGLDRGPIDTALGQDDPSAGPVVQPRAVFHRHDADKLLAVEPVDDTTGDVQKLGETVGGRFQNGLDLKA